MSAVHVPPPPAGLSTTSGLQLFDTVPAVLRFVLKDLLTRPSLTLLCGRPKIGKSWLALQIALAVAHGQRLLGRFAAESPGKICYLALEEPPSRTSLRLQRLTSGRDEALANIRFCYRINPLLSGGAMQLNEFLTANPCVLVIVDTLLAFVRQNDHRDAVRSDYQEIDLLRQISVKHDCGIVVIHHLRKATADYALDAVVGTSGVTAACDAVWTLRRLANGETLLDLTGRDVEATQYGLRLQTEDIDFGWKLVSEGPEAALSPERTEILDLLKDEGPQKPAAIARQLGKNGATVRRLLQGLVAEGAVEKRAEGTYVPSSICHEQHEQMNK
jgi:RecA-family ATPase